jgi:hypothetical protein
MGPLEIMSGILMGYLIIANLSDVMNMLILWVMILLGLSIGVAVYYVGRSVLLTPDAPYYVAAMLFMSFVTWKFSAPGRDPVQTLDRRSAMAGRKAGTA